MIAAALLLGIFLAVIIATRPATAKVLFSATLKIVIALLCSIFAAYIVFIAMHVPAVDSYFIGQVFGCAIIILICVAIGNAIRRRKDKSSRHPGSN